MTDYCARADVYALGLPSDAFSRPPRVLEGVNQAAGLFLLRAHGLVSNHPVSFAANGSTIPGLDASALPARVSPGVTYYAVPSSSDAFGVATTVGGTAIAPFSDGGNGSIGVIVDHGPYLDQAITAASKLIEAVVIAHRAPFTADVLKIVCARLSARIYVEAQAGGNLAYIKSIEASGPIQKLIDEMLELWLCGAPLPAGSTDATPLVGEDSPMLVDLDSRGFLMDGDDEARV